MQVARDVYGDEKIWRDIVLWNEIEAPYPIHAGQIISLHRVDNLKYKVTEKAPLLAMIALENYGNIKMMDLIAQWNGLSTQEKLKKGQILILKRPPTLFLKDRTAMLIKIWKKLNRNDVVAQIENESKPIKRSVGLIDESRKNPFEKAERLKQSQALVPTENFTPQESRKPTEFKESSHESYWLGDEASKIFKVLSLDKKFNP